jgi:CSLREA domain-containing protein
MSVGNVIFFLLTGVSVFASPSLHASAFFTVNTLADQVDDNVNDGACHTSSNTCSLRAAIMQANHLKESGMTLITVPAGTYQLTLACPLDGEECGDLNLTAPLVADQSIFINGAGAHTTIIDAKHSDRAMWVAQGREATVVGVTIRNGYRYDNGGGILNDGTLAVIDLVIENNVAEYNGGGIFSTGVLNIRGSTFRSNVATQGSGGGIDSRGDSTVQYSTLYSNRAGAFGGGAVVDFGHLYVANSTISSNAANKNGGGIANFAVTGLYNASVIDNQAAADYHQPGGTGGGVHREQHIDRPQFARSRYL